MIEIKYKKSIAGLDNIFYFVYELKDLNLKTTEIGSELNYFINLFRENNIFDNDAQNPLQMIWSTHYFLKYKETPFVMVYDEDYDIISFAIDEKHIQKRDFIAEAIKKLIEKSIL